MEFRTRATLEEQRCAFVHQAIFEINMRGANAQNTSKKLTQQLHQQVAELYSKSQDCEKSKKSSIYSVQSYGIEIEFIMKLLFICEMPWKSLERLDALKPNCVKKPTRTLSRKRKNILDTELVESQSTACRDRCHHLNTLFFQFTRRRF